MDTLHKILSELNTQGKNQKDLTDFLGIQKSAVTQWKLGKNTSYLKHISKIAEFLGVSADYLLGTEQKNKSSVQLSNEDLQLFNDIKALTPEQQKALRVMVDSYKQK